MRAYSYRCVKLACTHTRTDEKRRILHVHHITATHAYIHTHTHTHTDAQVRRAWTRMAKNGCPSGRSSCWCICFLIVFPALACLISDLISDPPLNDPLCINFFIAFPALTSSPPSGPPLNDPLFPSSTVSLHKYTHPPPPLHRDM